MEKTERTLRPTCDVGLALVCLLLGLKLLESVIIYSFRLTNPI